jgi:hypothetical protein
MVVQQGEVVGLFCRHPQPVAVERFRHAAKTPDGVQRQVDGVELDVANGMQQRGTSLQGKGRPRGHVGGVNQLGAFGSAGQRWLAAGHQRGLCVYVNQIRFAGIEQGCDLFAFGGRVCQQQGIEGLLAQAGRGIDMHPYNSRHEHLST